MDDRRTSGWSAVHGAAEVDRPGTLGALGDAIVGRSEWYSHQAGRVLQLSRRGAPRWNALELLALLVGATLVEASVRRALQWIEREARTVELDLLLDEVQAMLFVVLESVEDDPELFSDALRVLRALEADMSEAATRTSDLRRPAQLVQESEPRHRGSRRVRAAAM